MAERTKLWIAAAMKRLMAKKPLDKIRVTEICREAEIERPTFYTNPPGPWRRPPRSS